MRKKAIFVVEGDADVRCALGEALHDLGARPVLFENADDLLTALEGDTPSLLVLDVHLPRRPAAELLYALKRTPRWSRLPTVVFTAWRDTSVPERLNIPVIAKPQARQLLDLCRAILRGSDQDHPAGSSASERSRRTGTAP